MRDAGVLPRWRGRDRPGTEKPKADFCAMAIKSGEYCDSPSRGGLELQSQRASRGPPPQAGRSGQYYGFAMSLADRAARDLKRKQTSMKAAQFIGARFGRGEGGTVWARAEFFRPSTTVQRKRAQWPGGAQFVGNAPRRGTDILPTHT